MRALTLIPILCTLIPSTRAAAEDWIRIGAPEKAGFEVLTTAGAHAGRETLVRFEQFRHALGWITGKADLRGDLPVRVILFRKSQDARGWPEGVTVARDRGAIVLAAGAPPSREVLRATARLLLETGLERMPQPLETALTALMSTLNVSGIRITIGRPVPPAERTREWARLQMLATSPEYAGRMRILFSNIRKGVDEETSYRNAFEKSRQEIDRELDRYVAAGQFQTNPVSSRPMAEKDFPEKPVGAESIRLALADLLVEAKSRPLYEAAVAAKAFAAEANEGLGLLDLQGGRNAEARARFAAAIGGGVTGTRAYIEYARLETDREKAVAALEKAIKLNPKSAEAHFLLGGVEHLKTAAALDPRRADYWQALAEVQLHAGDFGSAAKAWRSAEQASTTDEQRKRMQAARLAIEAQRLDWEAAEKKRVAEEKEREIRKLKDEAISEIRALEAKANQGKSPGERGKDVVEWWDGPNGPASAAGNLTQVDCIARQFRLVIETADGKPVRLAVREPAKITIIGSGEQTLGCGRQKPRAVLVGYFPKPDAKLGTAGDVATIEFK